MLKNQRRKIIPGPKIGGLLVLYFIVAVCKLDSEKLKWLFLLITPQVLENTNRFQQEVFWNYASTIPKIYTFILFSFNDVTTMHIVSNYFTLILIFFTNFLRFGGFRLG